MVSLQGPGRCNQLLANGEAWLPVLVNPALVGVQRLTDLAAAGTGGCCCMFFLVLTNISLNAFFFNQTLEPV